MTTKYQRYPEYKDSGVDWFKKIPTTWSKLSLGRVVVFIKNGSSAVQVEENINTVNVSRIETISNGEINFRKVGHVNRSHISSQFLLAKGDIQLSNINSLKIIGNCALYDSDHELFAGMNLLQIRANSLTVYPNYMFYQFKTSWFRNRVEANAKPAINQASIPASTLKRFDFLCPSIEEQQKIAHFLDYETAKIDMLIEKQQQLIKLLKEKRQAVISHAVTKGLNPNAPMRDSGIEWLGEVPEHWNIRRFKNLFKIRKRISGELGHDVLSITQKGIKVKDIESGGGQLSMDYSKYQLVYKGDFAMNHMDLLTGFVDISFYEGVTSPDYRVFTLEEKNSIPEYFLCFLQMGYINKLFFPFGQGAAHIGRWRLPTEAFNEFLAPLPPKEEQREIAEFILKTLDQMNALEEKAKKAIQLMQERRTSLISAAVTGKIDVRHWQAPKQENTVEEATA